MEERLAELEQRVAYLERELETSYEEYNFRRNVESIFSDKQDIEFRDGHYGYFARVTNLNGDEVQAALDRLDNRDLDSAVTETGEGIGMEIWSEPQF
jgi:hypothetical protein